jgi:hypothetical protein
MAVAEGRLRSAAVTLRADVATAEVVKAFAARAIPCVLLRGPALVQSVGSRTYGDVDLLVSPAQLEAAEAVLERLGFKPATRSSDFPLRGEPHAHEWLRRADGAAIDLHRTVSGLSADAEEVWSALSRHAEPLDVAGVQVLCPGPEAQALLVALHAAHHGPNIARPIADLRAALDRLPQRCWPQAAALAERLSASPAFAAGLRLDVGGAALARELGLPDDMPAHVALRATGAPPPALGLLGLAEARGLRAKARLVLRGLAPSPAALRLGRGLARRGRLGLLAAYSTHPFWLLRYMGPSVVAVRRVRREAR